MKRFVGLAFSAGLVLAAPAAHAQMLARPVSDFDGPYERPYSYGPPPAYEPPPYAEPAPRPPAPVYGYGGGYDDGGGYDRGYGAPLLPLPEVYAVLRENGFSPLGAPHLHGFTYAIAAMDRRGENGRLTIDARDGRILRFVPGYGYGPYGENFGSERMSYPGPEAALPPPHVIYGTQRPPAPAPHVASRSALKPAIAARPAEPAQPPQRSAAIEPRPATPPAAPRSVAPPALANASQPPQPHAAPAAPASAAPAPNATTGESKPLAAQPEQPMPPVQGFE